MVRGLASRLKDYFEERTQENLRSVISYEQEEYEIVYLRDDVTEKYTREQLRDSIDNTRLESMTAPVYDSLYSDDHGELTCLVKCFEHVVELNFVLGDFEGVTIGLDEAALAGSQNLVAGTRQIFIEERAA